MQNIKFSELSRSLGRELLSLYLVAGDDDFLADSAVSAIANKLQEQGADEPLRYRFDTITEDELEVVAMGMSFFGARRVVILTDVTASNRVFTERRKALFTELFSDMPDDLTIILRYTDSESYRFSVPKSLSELVGRCRNSAIVNCERKTINLPAAITRMIEREGCTASDRVVRMLCDRCADDLMLAHSEVSKLAALAAYGEITTKHVEALSVRIPEDNVYEMLSALERGDVKTALATLADMLSQKTNPIYISSALNTAFINSYRARLARDKGLTEGWLVEHFAYKKGDRRLSIAMSRCGRYTIPQLERILDILYDLDVKLKSSRVDRGILLERGIIRLALTLKNA